ncbi:MAG TPA: acyl-CoA dehydrogenase family protein [Acidimicrobiia bacterium]|nr:acyl-CoA dehydrogenase family protein [Acidimicrobiia bacterium]
MSPTHEVLNQPPPIEGLSGYLSDRALVEAVRREGAAWAEADLTALGELAWSSEAREWGRTAEANPPVLRSHDRYGNRIDFVEYHPSYHRLMSTAIRNGLHAAAWRDDRPGAHVARCAKTIVWSPVDYGHMCPLSMTYAVVAALRHAPDLATVWEPRLESLEYDPSQAPAETKRGITAGMAMTEKQGGSDVRANTTIARPTADGGYLITGHKWFCSAPMSDVFLVLAQAPSGLTCFLMPRWRPDGTRNAIAIMRLKDKMGDRSNASSEVEYDGALAWRVGEEGRGVATIIEMVNRTRLDCALGAAAQMRHGVVEAAHHAIHREAFGKQLVEQPLMRSVLADLAIESEAATAAAMRVAGAYDRGEDAFARLATPIVKYWLTKRVPGHAAEALECIGGTGYVEESGMPRLFRQSPLNGIWEGSGNVICLDVLRAVRRDPTAVEAFFAEVALASGSDARFDGAARDLRAAVDDLDESGARRFVERAAVLLQASLLLRNAPEPVADLFVRARITDPGVAYGSVLGPVPLDAVLDRALPV